MIVWLKKNFNLGLLSNFAQKVMAVCSASNRLSNNFFLQSNNYFLQCLTARPNQNTEDIQRQPLLIARQSLLNLT